jgi:hypothetical protein
LGWIFVVDGPSPPSRAPGQPTRNCSSGPARDVGAAIAAQRRSDDSEGAELDRLVAVIERDGGDRTYAGMPSNPGQDFTVGAVPVFKYLESRDVDEVGYTLRTASLMTDPEYFVDDRDPSDYRLFAIHDLIIPPAPDLPSPLGSSSGPAPARCGRYLAPAASCTPARSSVA